MAEPESNTDLSDRPTTNGSGTFAKINENHEPKINCPDNTYSISKDNCKTPVVVVNGTPPQHDRCETESNTDDSTNKPFNLELYLNQKNSKTKLEMNPLFDQSEVEQLLSGSDKIMTDEKPVLRVQFNHRDSNFSIEKPQCPSPSPLSSDEDSSSNSSSSESLEISEARPPDGGWGWVVVAASFIVNLIADGVTFSFGVIFREFLKYFGENRGTTAWVGGLFMAIPLISGPIASFLTDRYGCRKVTIFGALLASAGFIVSSMANSMLVLCITFGVFAGFGLSLCYVASVVIVAYYFDKKRSFATGLAVCGSGIGTFVFAPLIQFLLDEYGWRGTTLILAGLFLNLVVCGALMRDLPWTSAKQKSLAKERKKNRNMKRKNKLMSTDSFSVSTVTFTPSALPPVHEGKEQKSEHQPVRMCNSLIHLPTYIKEGEKLPAEVLELLAANKNVYNVLLANYPNLLTPSKSFSDSGRLNEAAILSSKHANTLTQLSPPMGGRKTFQEEILWLRNNAISEGEPEKNLPPRKLPTAFLKDLRVHRLSVSYRGAMLNLKRYRLRASSCPDIYRNSMTTIAQEKIQWWWDFWDVLVDMFDFSHFADPKFLVFALSNFLLYTWYDVPYVYLTDNASQIGYTDKQASVLISIIGIINMVGEIILGWLGDRSWANAGLIYALCMVLCGGVIALVPLVTSYTSLGLISGAFGFLIAANYSLTCVILVELISLERFTNAYGLLLLVQGFANLVGPPLAGWLYDITGTYDLSFYLSGFFIAISGVLLVIIPVVRRYKRYVKEQTSDDVKITDQQTKHIRRGWFSSCLGTFQKQDLEKGSQI